MGRVSDYITKKWGCLCDSQNRVQGLILATPNQLAPPNPNRFQIVMVNMGANIAYANITSAVGPANGIQMAAAGAGRVVINAEDDGDLPTREWWGIGAGATNILIIETVAIA